MQRNEALDETKGMKGITYYSVDPLGYKVAGCDVTDLVAVGGTGRLQTPRPGLAWMQPPWPALHGCMAGSGDGSGDEVRFGTVSLDLFGPLHAVLCPPGGQP